MPRCLLLSVGYKTSYTLATDLNNSKSRLIYELSARSILPSICTAIARVVVVLLVIEDKE